MKRIITTNPGGHPYSLTDYQHLQDSYTEIVNNLVRTQTTDNIVRLYGVEVLTTTNGASTTAGAIFYNNEIFQVDSHTVTGTGTLFFVVEETYLPGNPVMHQDLQARNVHAIRKLRLRYDSGDFQLSQLKNLPIRLTGSEIQFDRDLRVPSIYTNSYSIATTSPDIGTTEANNIFYREAGSNPTTHVFKMYRPANDSTYLIQAKMTEISNTQVHIIRTFIWTTNAGNVAGGTGSVASLTYSRHGAFPNFGDITYNLPVTHVVSGSNIGWRLYIKFVNGTSWPNGHHNLSVSYLKLF